MDTRRCVLPVVLLSELVLALEQPFFVAFSKAYMQRKYSCSQFRQQVWEPLHQTTILAYYSTPEMRTPHYTDPVLVVSTTEGSTVINH